MRAWLYRIRAVSHQVSAVSQKHLSDGFGLSAEG